MEAYMITRIAFVAWMAAAMGCATAVVAAPVVGSVTAVESVTGGRGSYAPKVSASGRYVVFVSHANNLASNGGFGLALNVFRRDLLLNETVLVSVNLAGNGGGDGDSTEPDISADGRYVSFVSIASNLVNNDTNGQADVFIRDVTAGVTSMVSVDASGAPSSLFLVQSLNALASGNARISASGRRIVFESIAPNLVASDTNGIRDIFLRDLDSATTLLLTPGSSVANESPTNYFHGSFRPVMTPDGSRVAFISTATNDAPRFGNPMGEICVRDVAAERTYWASSNAATLLA